MPKPPEVNAISLLQRWRRKPWFGLFGRPVDHRKDGPALVQQPIDTPNVVPMVAGNLVEPGAFYWMHQGDPHRRNGPCTVTPNLAEWRILDVTYQRQNLRTGKMHKELWAEGVF